MSTLTETTSMTNGHNQCCRIASKSSDFKPDYDYFFTPITKTRGENYLRMIADKMSNIQGKAFKFSNGIPNPKCFPFEEVSVKLKNGHSFHVKGSELDESLSYSNCHGYQPLINLLKNYQDRFHGNQDWTKKNLSMTCGSMGGLHQLLEMCVSPGDPILVQSPLYTGVITVLNPLNAEFIEVESGPNGICTERLANILHERRKRNLPMPKVFYLNPIGSNPTGEVISNEIKQEIYKIACEYNILIFEDDAYFLLSFKPETPTSFLALDNENRVVRFDTISKTVGAGFRLGYVTAPNEIIDKLNIVKGSTNYCTPFGQVIVYETLNSMGFDGFMKHIDFIRSFYYENLKTSIKCLDIHLKDVATWDVPEAGLFIWLTIKNIDHISDDFINKCIKKLIYIVPGFAFYGIEKLSPCIRLCFSMLEQDEIEEGIEILAGLIKEEVAEQMNNKTKHRILSK